MPLNLSVPVYDERLTPRISVVGVGGAGGNAINNMIRSNLEGVSFVIANTDSQALRQSLCETRIQLGRDVTSGLGAGSRPEIGRAAAEESLDELMQHLEGANMVFITAGMGGGTGTGAAPVIARAAREAGILTVGVVTKPFQFEGMHRLRLAESGIQELSQYVDTLIIIPNQNLFRIANDKTTFADAFKMADDVLHSGVSGVTDLMIKPGVINLDFADIRAVMTEMGKAMMGTGEASGDNRAMEAAEAAISNPLLDDVSMKGARGLLISIAGGEDLTLFEVDEAANRISQEADPEANIIFGTILDESMNGRLRISVVATGIDLEAQRAPRPVPLQVVGGRGKPAEVAAAPAARGQAAAPLRAAAAVAPQPAPQPAVATASEAVAMEEPTEEFEEFADEAAQADRVEETRVEPAAAMLRRSEPPRAERSADGGFISPEPLRPANRFAAALRPQAQQRPAEESHHQPDAAAAQPSRAGGGLLSRIAGLGRKAEPARPAHHEPRAEPAFDGRAAQRAPGEAPMAPAMPSRPLPQAQPSFAGFDRNDRGAASRDDEELLDIPAFLRRQAN